MHRSIRLDAQVNARLTACVSRHPGSARLADSGRLPTALAVDRYAGGLLRRCTGWNDLGRGTERAVQAEAFAAFGESHNWQVEARRFTHRDYPDKRYLQAGWTVIARSGAVVVTATWIERSHFRNRTDRLALDTVRTKPDS